MSEIQPLATEHDRSDLIFTVILILAVLATVFMFMRMVSKGFIVRKLTLDDWMALLAWAFCTASSVCIMIGAKTGLGRIGSEIKPEWVAPLRQSTYAFTVFYNPAIMTIKVAVLILYIRMSAAHRFLRWASIATMSIVVLTGIICTFITIFRCRPVRAAWSGHNGGQCIDVISLYLSTAPINILTDLAILLLPLPILTSLRMEFRQKVVLVTTFIVGGFVTIVDVIRAAYLQQALKSERLLGDHGIASSARFGDFAYYISFALMWSCIESSVGLMCCCVLVLKPLVMRVIPAMLKENRELSNTARADVVGLTELSKSPRSPISPKSSQSPTQPRQISDPEEPRLEAEEDDDMDFFQMLNSDPPAGGLANGPGGPPPPPPPLRGLSNPGLLTIPNYVPPAASESPPKFSNITRHLSKQTLGNRLRSNSTKRAREASQAPSGTFFDFVNMGGNKPMSQLRGRESWSQVLFVSILFFLWGFSYGLLGTLNGHIQTLLDAAPSQNIGLHSAYWVGYFFGPIVSGYWILHRHGFKTTFVTGLAIYGAGAMAFWPSSVLLSYAGFFISNFIVAVGLSTLEVAANPFIALCGPGETSEARLNFAQAIQAIGTIASSILANKLLFITVSPDQLFKVQWCYLAVSMFVLFLAAVFYYAPVSEANDDDLEREAMERFERAGIERHSRRCGLPTRLLLLAMGVYMTCTYSGAQESVSFIWANLVSYMKPTVDPFWTRTIGQAVFFVGRAVASIACYLGIPPRHVLAFYVGGSFLTSLLGMMLSPSSAPVAMLILYMFFESAIFPTAFAMALRGQGRHSKAASAAMIAGVSGAGVFPSISWKVEQVHRPDSSFALIVPTVLYGIMMLYPMVLSGSWTLRRWVDPRWSRTKGDDAPAGGVDKTPLDKGTREGQEPVLSTTSGIVGLGVSLNGGTLKETTSFGSIGMGMGMGMGMDLNMDTILNMNGHDEAHEDGHRNGNGNGNESYSKDHG